MASIICVLCFVNLERKPDINLVSGKRIIDIAAEIESETAEQLPSKGSGERLDSKD